MTDRKQVEKDAHTQLSRPDRHDTPVPATIVPAAALAVAGLAHGETGRATLDARRLEVGRADDPAEVEADRVAHEVVAALGPQRITSSPSTGTVRRALDPTRTGAAMFGAAGGMLAEPLSTSVDSARAGSGGHPLSTAVRRVMEGALHTDLSAVRVHTGPHIDAWNERLSASAFTVGSDVFFRGGLPSLSSPAGTHLLAHELTHVRQNRAGAGAAPVRRAVELHPGTGRYFSTHDRKKTFATEAEADEYDQEREKKKAKAAGKPMKKPYDRPGTDPEPRRSPRVRTATRNDEGLEYAPVKSGGGGGRFHVDRTGYDISSRAAFAASPSVQTQLGKYKREDFPSTYTQQLIDAQMSRPTDLQTEEDQRMSAVPTPGLKDEEISRNHKLADSSIAAICYQMVEVMRTTAANPTQNAALKEFTKATGAAQGHLDALLEAVNATDSTRRKALTDAAIKGFSQGLHNVRFGNAITNGLVGWAYDPNRFADGTETPLSEAIAGAVRRLSSSKLIPDALDELVSRPI